MKITIAVLSLLFSCFFLNGQPAFRPVDTLPYANFQDNNFYYNEKTSLLVPFFDKLDSVITTGAGHVNIIHIGGSHVQAGTYPHRIRKNILLEYPDLIAGRGMIFPYSVAKKSNNPQDYKVSKKGEFTLLRNVKQEHEKPLGVTGIAVYTSDTIAEITLSMNANGVTFETNKITLFGFSDSMRVTPLIKIDTIEYLPVNVDTALRRYSYQVLTFTDTFKVILPADSSNVFTLTGILLENDNPGITYHSLGVNGASVPAFLRCEYFVEDLKTLQPDLVIFGLGINDASGPDFDTVEFVNNYLLLVEQIKEVNPDCAFIFITNNDSYKKVSKNRYTVNPRGEMVQRQCYLLADITRGAVWDQFHIMGGLKSMDKWRIDKLAKTDRVHFTNAGYELLGDLFYNAFVAAQQRCAEIRDFKRKETELLTPDTNNTIW